MAARENAVFAGGAVPEPTEIKHGCDRVNEQLGRLHDNLRLLRERLEPVIEVRPKAVQAAPPVAGRNSPLGTTIHGYADGLDDINNSLLELASDLAL